MALIRSLIQPLIRPLMAGLTGRAAAAIPNGHLILRLDFRDDTTWDILGRTSLAAIIAYQRAYGVSRIQTAMGHWGLSPANALRLDGYANRGLLVEPLRQDIAKYGSDFTNVLWVKSNMTAVLGETGIDGLAPVAATQIVLTSGTTWVVPLDWDSANNEIIAIGPGGNGAAGTINTNGGGGGGGGAYSKIVNASLTAGSTITVQVPAAGSELPTLLKNNSNTTILSADYGRNAVGATRGNNATAGACVGDPGLKISGGIGGNGSSGTGNRGGGSGGGAGGPLGDGGSGAGGNANGGGGGAAASNGENGNAASAALGGEGGDGPGGTGHGVGGTAVAAATPGGAGTGSGGGGGFSAVGIDGANGSAQDLWDTAVGPGGGGGGGGKGGNGGNGGGYGAGGAGGGSTAATAGNAGVGSQGVLIVRYGERLGVTKLTATADNATVLQTATSALADRTTSGRVQILSGTWFMTMDNGATWTEIEAPDDELVLVDIPSQSLANPVFGLKAALAGAEIIVADFQHTTGLYPTSPILTTNAVVSRPADEPWVDLTPYLSRIDTRRLSCRVGFHMNQLVDGNCMMQLFSQANPSTQCYVANWQPGLQQWGVTVIGDTQGYDPQDINTSIGDHIMAWSYDAVDSAIAVDVDGSTPRTGTPSSHPANIDGLNIGHQNGTNHWGDYIHFIELYAGAATAEWTQTQSAAP